MFRSATFKLTVWYLALVMVISLIFSIVLYHVAAGELANGLHHETARIYQQFPVFENMPLLHPNLDYATSAHRLLLRLIGFNFVVLIGAGFSSYWLARRTLEPIEAAHEQQKRFTADVSHELRTPLTALRMESEVALLNKQSTQKELRDTLGSNLEEISKLEALINNLLRLTRLEADELQEQFETVSSATIIQAALQETEKVAKRRKITIDNKTKDLKLFGDGNSLTQLLIILIDNAIKYSSSGSAVALTSKKRADQVLLEIKDHGVGIDAAALEHVFDRFYRADNSRTKQTSEGFGLGLSIAKMIADVHHGDITIHSRAGHGTTVVVSLPTPLTDKPTS